MKRELIQGAVQQRVSRYEELSTVKSEKDRDRPAMREISWGAGREYSWSLTSKVSSSREQIHAAAAFIAP